MQFEGDEIALAAVRACPAAEIVFAVGEKDCARAQRLAVAKLREPEIVAGCETVNKDAAFNCASALLGAGEHGLIEGEPGEGECREGQR